MMLSAPGLFTGSLALSAVKLTPELTSTLVTTIADKLVSSSVFIIGDLIIYVPRRSPTNGKTLNNDETKAILKPLYGPDTTEAFLALLYTGELHGSSFQKGKKGFSAGPHMPSQFIYEVETVPQASTQAKQVSYVSPYLYDTAKEKAATIVKSPIPVTIRRIPVQMLRHIAKEHFERAVFLALGARRFADGREVPIREGQEIVLTTGAHFQNNGCIEDCLFVSEKCHRSRLDHEFPKVFLRYHRGQWVIRNWYSRGSNAIYLANTVLTVPPWGIKHDGQRFQDRMAKNKVSAEVRALRKAILAMTDKLIELP